MKIWLNLFFKVIVTFSFLLLTFNSAFATNNLDEIGNSRHGNEWRNVENIFDKTGTLENDVFKLTFPRSDLDVEIDGTSIDPELALTSWLAFKKINNQTMLMGDIVLLESELDAVVTKLLASGIDITALHNHLINESPSIMFLHVRAMGDPVTLAQSIKSGIEITSTPISSKTNENKNSYEWEKVETILGRKGTKSGNVIKFSIPKNEEILVNGMKIPPVMGTATAINFQKVGKKTAITGDFVLFANEVNTVAKVLQEHNITVTALHNHMLNEEPRLFYMHFWAVDNPETLARSLRKALNKIE